MDSGWEKTAAKTLDKNPKVIKWVKNDKHIGLKIPYLAEGEKHDYIPDFIIEIENGGSEKNVMLILEVKGKKDLWTGIKHEQLGQWIKAMNQEAPDYIWMAHMLKKEGEVNQMIETYSNIKEKN